MINYIEPYQTKLLWRVDTKQGVWLVCYNASAVSPGTLEKVQQWSNEHQCGNRIAWHTWKFKSKEEMTVFLLKWS